MNELKNQIVNLKKTIFKITKNVCGSDSENKKLAFKAFVQLALHTGIHTLGERYAHHGLPSSMINHHINVGEALIQYEGKHKDLEFIDLDSLIESVNLYNNIVKQNEPFLDILSFLAEEITISKAQAFSRGQFMTPPDLAQLVVELLDAKNDKNNQQKISDICVGYGALILAKINRAFKENPQSLCKLEILINDLDPFMCNVAALQIISNTVNNNIDVKQLVVLCSDAIKQYKTGEVSFVIKYRTPELVIKDIERIRGEKAVQKVIEETKLLLDFLHESVGAA